MQENAGKAMDVVMVSDEFRVFLNEKEYANKAFLECTQHNAENNLLRQDIVLPITFLVEQGHCISADIVVVDSIGNPSFRFRFFVDA